MFTTSLILNIDYEMVVSDKNLFNWSNKLIIQKNIEKQTLRIHSSDALNTAKHSNS